MLNWIEERASSVQIENVSESGIQMLDLWVSRGAKFRKAHRLDVCIRPKETSIADPLLATSAHPFSVHKAWPQAMLRRWDTLSSDRKGLKTELTKLREKWHRYQIIDLPNQTNQPTKEQTLRCILPYSRVWAAAGLAKCFAGHPERLRQVMWGLPVPRKVSLAWALGQPHLLQKLRIFGIRKVDSGSDDRHLIRNRFWRGARGWEVGSLVFALDSTGVEHSQPFRLKVLRRLAKRGPICAGRAHGGLSPC